MNPVIRDPFVAPRSERIVVALTAVVCGCAVIAFVMLLFAGASRHEWLEATPDNVAAMQRCDALLERAEKRHCAQAVVVAVRQRANGSQLAHAASAVTAAR